MGAKKESTYSSFLIGIAPWYETKLKFEKAEPVATILAPLTTTPASVSLTAWTQTSARSWMARSRSTGGWMIAWFR